MCRYRRGMSDKSPILSKSTLLIPILTLALATGGVSASNAAPSGESGGTTVRTLGAEGVIVVYKAGTVRAQRVAVRARHDLHAAQALPLRGTEVVKIPAQRSTAAVVSDLEADSRVAYAEPNYVVEAFDLIPDDPRFPDEWALDNDLDTDIDATQAWDYTQGSGDVTVAVVDSGVAYDHPDLGPNLWLNQAETPEGSGVDDDGNGYVDDSVGWDWVEDDGIPTDPHGHGTHVAGTIGARGNDGFGVAGVSWDVRLMPLRALDSTGSGTIADVASAFVYAGEMGADVVNASLGGAGFSNTLRAAIEGAPGTLFVVAAGNSSSDNDTAPNYPCSYSSSNLICVAATDETGELAWFSNYGATTVDLAAPGEGILSTKPDGGFTTKSGTSMATPHVSGVAALLLAHRPSTTVTDATAALLGAVDSAASLDGKTVTGGRLNAWRALDPVAGTDPKPSPTPSPQRTLPPSTIPVEHDRAVSLRVSDAFVARGRVTVSDGFGPCRSRVRVRIKRDGEIIRTLSTNRWGHYRSEMPRKQGRFVAKAPLISVRTQDVCQAVMSRPVRR
jgi:subtilisin family serine protease